MALTRAAIHAFATHCGKLNPVVVGAARPELEMILQYQPNPLMDAYTFLYRLATILKVENTAFIAPYMDGQKVIGYWPVRSLNSEVRVINGRQYLVYDSPLNNGRKDSIEFDRVGVLRNHAYTNYLYGDSNSALDTTLNLLYTQDQGIINGVQNSANIRFLARLANVLKKSDIADERKRFKEENLSSENNGGVLLVDSKYADVKQIESKQMLVDDKQAALIRQNVYEYMGVSEKIITNSFDEETWNAFYEGAIEPFAIQLSLVMTNMQYTAREKSTGNRILFEANRLQYASNTTKISLVTQLFDRGFITQNQGLEIFNMAPVADGDKRWIRGEYIPVDKVGDTVPVMDQEGDDG